MGLAPPPPISLVNEAIVPRSFTSGGFSFRGSSSPEQREKRVDIKIRRGLQPYELALYVSTEKRKDEEISAITGPAAGRSSGILEEIYMYIPIIHMYM
jgi:hypothetical protein